jgi:hypothetical protein
MRSIAWSLDYHGIEVRSNEGDNRPFPRVKGHDIANGPEQESDSEEEYI